MVYDPENLPTDFFLMRDGPVSVTSDAELWRAGAEWLAGARGFQAHHWTLADENSFHAEVSRTLKWKHQFGYSTWSGNLDALNDGASGLYLLKADRLLVTVRDGQRLKNWFGSKTSAIWEIFVDAARLNLMFGVGVLVWVHTASEGEAKRWAKAPGVMHVARKSFPGAAVALEAGLTRR